MQKNDDWQSIHPKQLIDVAELLLKKGYSETAVRGIFGENYLRVLNDTLSN